MNKLEQLNKIDAAGRNVAKTAVDSMSVAKVEAGGVGQGIVDGVTMGVQLNSWRLFNQMRSLAAGATAAANVELKVNSPSKKTA